MSPETLAALARACAGSHRLGMVAQGGEDLARLVDGLLGLFGRAPERAQALAPLLAELAAAQRRGDWIGLADRLEHELAPALAAAGVGGKKEE